jgi:hypothetical protein
MPKGDHLQRDLGRALQVVGRAGRDLAVEDQRLRPPTHEHGDAVSEIVTGEHEAILGRPLLRRIGDGAVIGRIQSHKRGIVTPRLIHNTMAAANRNMQGVQNA